MEQMIVSPGKMIGEAWSPPSKSVSQRALAASLLRSGKTILKNLGASQDEKTAFKLIEDLGAVSQKEASEKWEIYSDFPFNNFKKNRLNFGESGLSLRMFTPIVSIFSKKNTLDAEGSLRNRPLMFSEELFLKLGVKLERETGNFPFSIQGPLKPTNIRIDGSKSSQFLTGLLMSFSALQASDVVIEVENLKSKPYIDLTLDVMSAFKMKMPKNRDYTQFYFPDSNSIKDTSTEIIEYTIEADWSNAAFLIIGGVLNGEIYLKGLNFNSFQGDREILNLLQNIGANVSIEKDVLVVQSSAINAFEFDATQCPDLFPPLVSLAANCIGVSIIKGVTRLFEKESNRALSLQTEFAKLGISITIEDDYMYIKGGIVKGGEVDSHNDHRIAMACAIAALKSEQPVIINRASAVNKSFPAFFDTLSELGISCKTSKSTQ